MRKYAILILILSIVGVDPTMSQCVNLISPFDSSTLKVNSQLEFNWNDKSKTYILRIFNGVYDSIIGNVSSGFWMNAQGVLSENTTYQWELLNDDTVGSVSCKPFTFTTTESCDPPMLFDESLITYYNDFNATSSIDDFSGSSSNHILLSSDNSYSGNGLSVMNLMPAGKNRSELSYKSQEDKDDRRNHINREMYYNYKIMIPRPLQTGSGRRLITQWHSQPLFSCREDWGYEGPPPVSVNVDGDVIKMGMRWPVDSIVNGGSPYGTFEIPYGEWFDVLIHIKWSLEYDGFIEMFVNGQPNTPYNGVDNKVYGKTLKNTGANYLKFGQYTNSPTEGTDTIYFDNLNINVLTNRPIEKELLVSSKELLVPDTCFMEYKLDGIDSLDFINSFELSLIIPEGSEFVSFDTTNSLVQHGEFMFNQTNDTLKIAYIQTDPIFGTDRIFSISILLKEGGEYEFSPYYFALNGQKQKVSGGEVSVLHNSIDQGDIDFDYKITAYDASLALQYAVGLDPLPNNDPLPWLGARVEIADVNSDHIVGAMDASLILRRSLGLIKSYNRIASFDSSIRIKYDDGLLHFFGNEHVYSVSLVSKQDWESEPIFHLEGLKAVNEVNNNISIAGYHPLEREFMELDMNLGEHFELNVLVNDEYNLVFKEEDIIHPEDQLIVYPNPVISILLISHPELIEGISIYDSSSRLLRQYGSVSWLDMNDLKKGTYFIHIDKLGGDSQIFKILKVD
ncbi:MAG: heparin lyase I family protein [Cyclobacteriaceae bacterium]